MREFVVKHMNTPVGSVTLKKEGLYCHIHCTCVDLGSVMRLVDVRGTETISIGICGPISDGFGVDRKLPWKYMEAMEHTFILLSETFGERRFYPLDSCLPTEVLTQPEKLRFCVQNKKPGVMIGIHREYMHCYPSK